MKKIVALIGSRRKSGNTATFVRSILNNLPKDEFEYEYIFPQDYIITPCSGCGICFNHVSCALKDDFYLLQEKILESDIFVVASPVYLHYMTADLKLILDRCAWWTHILRLQGKPTIVLSTCDANGNKKVIEPLSQIMTYMGGNVIATANGSQIPNQINNKTWLNSISQEINRRIISFFEKPLKSNVFLEDHFSSLKQSMKIKKNYIEKMNLENGEVNYWKVTGMLDSNSYCEYLLTLRQNAKQQERQMA